MGTTNQIIPEPGAMVRADEILWIPAAIPHPEDRIAVEDFWDLSREDLEVYTRSLQLDCRDLRLTLHESIAALARAEEQRRRLVRIVEHQREQLRELSTAGKAKAA